MTRPPKIRYEIALASDQLVRGGPLGLITRNVMEALSSLTWRDPSLSTTRLCGPKLLRRSRTAGDARHPPGRRASSVCTRRLPMKHPRNSATRQRLRGPHRSRLLPNPPPRSAYAGDPARSCR